MKLTSEIIENLNNDLSSLGAGFIYKFHDHPYSPTAQREIRTNEHLNWIDSLLINCTDEFYDWLDKWFKDNYNITLCYNNTGSIMWSNDFT